VRQKVTGTFRAPATQQVYSSNSAGPFNLPIRQAGNLTPVEPSIASGRWQRRCEARNGNHRLIEVTMTRLIGIILAPAKALRRMRTAVLAERDLGSLAALLRQ
jgi:hypothetical protein